MSYVDGFVIPVPVGNREAYRALAAKAAPVFQEYGALRIVESWGDDLPDRTNTDFTRAVKAETGAEAMLSMVKLDVGALEKAFEGRAAA